MSQQPRKKTGPGKRKPGPVFLRAPWSLEGARGVLTTTT